ncbi:PREDICTED: golgin subfamily A member 6-like protein 6 [Camelina sativa]|uniref:Golgin subfamily A member 6-like protein 6 n=1 Tax=Camelina sativa TaxID=90675 RepID=A0ABM1QX44_CAMSA|nr:PREDICTED: golgin subfamily A member 6-like protein 6 [Camelina sativa]XP_010445473.1 PREDICTED: golgin subfamily A member 6-like protein 6 [Camelina sativa]XP_019091332.1 PREDICTED: golgin subfamily A member 6-like protein 6 [Camelina sativa]
MSKGDEKQSEMRSNMMLFGLLIRKIFDEEKSKLLQRLEDAKSEITELKKVRNEDAKANEKVVSIFASQKQNWLRERYGIRLQIEALMKELRNIEKRKRKSLSEMQERLKEKEGLVESKDKAMEEEKRKCKELEERLVKAEKEVQDLRETQEREVQEHSSELWRQKKTFLELASSQRQLEAELSRANKQIEAKGLELEDLSLEIIKLRKDLEQKDRILGVMMKKSKLDMTEKQMALLKEAKRKQDEEEVKKWRTNSKSRKHERRSLRSMFAFEATSKSKTNSVPSITHIEHLELNKDPDVIPQIMDSYSIGDLNELGVDEIAKKRENLTFGEEELCIRVIGKKGEIELGEFTDHMKLKDEKVEALCLHLMNSELELKRLRSCIEGMNQEMSQLRHENTQLEGMVNRRGEESVSLKKQELKTQFKSLIPHKNNTSCRRKDTEPEEREKEFRSREVSQENATEKGRESYSPDELRHLTLKAAQSDAEEGSENERLLPEKREKGNGKESKSLIRSSSTNNPPWRMDLHALGVSYKIKRLKQQLMMLERYIGKPESQEIERNSSDTGKRALLLIITLLNKQVTRYQSLQEKIDDLCKRMHVNDPEKISGKIRANGEAKTSLEHFLDETFQLQRYIVATGQKLMEIQSKIASGFVEVLVGIITTESSSSTSSFDAERFAESIKSLFREVQRGLEVRISRSIGDLEGTLAREGMIHLKRRGNMELRV